ncbi:carboxypeptidase-like regulatory domain-containing protein [Bacteroides sp. 224]|uniref:carboxypeptidase-like regulatory domain-containing protein n=1 Tax=Bacteroides sp. 224 TaxID=2302936 RepID=UPI0013D49F72|nr:carboxypeptidase-like regulatory domain-containing protein [Bacteroides sp. 224]NDV67210.1 hypothetical protein [Bacteroides sp. 224]
MNTHSHLLKISLLSILCWLTCSFIHAQPINWKYASDETFVFQINNKEALKLLQSNNYTPIISKMLHTPIGSFKGTWTDMPEKGHFIFANIYKNTINYRYHPVMPFQVFLFKEYGVLTLQVVDKEGVIRKDAKVKLHKKRVYYDRISQTYTINDESNKTMRVLTVELDGYQAFFDLQKHIVNPIWNNNGSPHRPEFYSYLITDKNKYKPNEKVRFKSYSLTGSKRPLKKNLEVWLKSSNYNNYFYKKITEVPAHRPGGFAGEIQLHDSLKLRLDTDYSIHLREAGGRIVANTSFRYEDYELLGNKLDIGLSMHNHYYPHTNKLEIRATDANGLLLPDLKADITIKRRNVLKSYTSVLLLPDTLLHRQMILDPYAPTLIDIPASLFGESDCEYEVSVSAVTVDNQPMVRTEKAIFYRSKYDVFQTVKDGKLRFSFSDLGVEKPIEAKISYNGGEKEKRIMLPYTEEFNQSFSSYEIEIPKHAISKSFPTHWIGAGLSLKGGINEGILDLSLNNPLNIEFTYYAYEGNVMIQKGAGKEFDFKKHTLLDENNTCYVEIFYFIGGQEKVYRRTFITQPHHLNVDIDLPERIYPGQQLTGQISVKDYTGRGVSGVDLTAFSFNSQLNYQVPDLPYLGDSPITREQRDSYSMHKKSYTYSAPLDFGYWQPRANLYEMEYYRFIYPKRMFKKVVETPDSITQFAPYVMYRGNEEKIYVIEVDDKPVYFSWTTQPKAYSFPVEPGRPHKITLRLHNRALIIEKMFFVPGKKMILSMDLEALPDDVVVLWLNSITSYESNRYQSFVAGFPPPSSRLNATYFRKDSVDYLIYHPSLSLYRKTIAGPIPQGYASYDGNVTYNHKGGYLYTFEDNIVYRENEPGAVPSYFSSSLSNNFSNLNDFHLSPQVLKQRIEGNREGRYIWNPSTIRISQVGLDLLVHLPKEKNLSGVANLLLQPVDSGSIIFPNEYKYGKKQFSRIPPGNYNAIVLYNDGKYLKQDSLHLTKGIYAELAMNALPLHEKDSLSEGWLLLSTHSGEIADRGYDQMPLMVENSTRFYRTTPVGAGTVMGYVYDTEGEPLIGVSVQVKGTSVGTITDVDGFFKINIGNYGNTLVFSYIGYIKKEVEIKNKTQLSVVLEEDNQTLDEVVVVGYGTSRRMSVTGSVSSVSSEPAKRAPDEEIEETEDDEESTREAEEKLYSELLLLNGLRRNFSDVGFWEPRLYTNRKGKAEFTVTFPDNITKWEAVVYAMNRRLMTGTGRKSIRSYKPLMGELKTPQFLTVGDSSYFVGTVRNYSQDSLVRGEVQFLLASDTLMRKDITLKNSHNDKLLVRVENTDSITTQYMFSRDDGYRDGEERSIPVVPLGTKLAKGSLGFLRNGETVTFQAEENENFEITLTGKQLDIYMNATYYLMGYEYACNEQLASKLIGLLNYRMYILYSNKEFKYDDHVNEIIRRLLLNQNDQQLWSWWGNSEYTSFWMSSHIIRALSMAKQMGYEVKLNVSQIENKYIYLAPYRQVQLHDIETLHALANFGVSEKYVAAGDSLMKLVRENEKAEDLLVEKHKYYHKHSFLKEKLQIWELQQQSRPEAVRDSLLPYLKEDILGRMYCSDDLRPYSWYSNALVNTLIAYRIVRKDSTLMHLKEPMQLYILASRQSGWNTYQASSAVETILPDLMAESSTREHIAGVRVTGKENKVISEFPYQLTLNPGEKLTIEKQDGMPLIYNGYSIKRVTEENITKAFAITTALSQSRLTEGVPVNMMIELEVKQEGAEYVMLEIPIPAGCSYANKNTSRGYRETYREYFKEKTMIYCQDLPIGRYTFVIELLPRYTGSYILNPAKAELMYFPVINANNGLRKVEVQNKNNTFTVD